MRVDPVKKVADRYAAALMLHHGDLYDGPPLTPKPEPPRMLPPIPNEAMAMACAMAFPVSFSRIEAVQRATLIE